MILPSNGQRSSPSDDDRTDVKTARATHATKRAGSALPASTIIVRHNVSINWQRAARARLHPNRRAREAADGRL